MADLTSTLTITGTINGRSISITHTYTLEDIADVGVMSEDGVGGQNHHSTLGSAPNNSYTQTNPEYLMGVNRDTLGVTRVLLTGLDVSINMQPGTVFCLTSSPGTGLGLETNSGTSIALDDLTSMETTTATVGGSALITGKVSSLAAFGTTT